MISSRKKRVLCIDPDSVSVRIRSAVLTTGGFEVIGHTSIEGARQLMRQHRFDAVVLDESACHDANGGRKRVTDAFPALPILLLVSDSPFSSKRGNGDARLSTFFKCEGPEAFLAAVRECIQRNSTWELANVSKPSQKRQEQCGQ